MIGLLIFTIIFGILISIGSAHGNSEESNEFLEKKKRPLPRGYYGGVGYPFVPFAEPLTILAGLAFIAYIIQAFNTLYHQNAGGLGGGGGGGLLNNVLPSKGKDLFSKANQNDVIELLE